MNYYTIYEKLLISLYFLCHLFFCKIRNISPLCKFLGFFFLGVHKKRLILRLYPGCYPGLGASAPSGRVWE